jgi:hypothetical protein
VLNEAPGVVFSRWLLARDIDLAVGVDRDVALVSVVATR